MRIKVDALTRVEGEGALDILLENGTVKSLKLIIYEPPRFIEGILKGKSYEVIPEITARICGICPIAYQISGVQAIENAFGLSVPGEIETIRRLIYYGEWIHSHALHVFFLHLPDFFKVSSIMDLAKVNAEYVKVGLEIKKAGSSIIQTIGGRTSHPVSICAGGFSHLPEDVSHLKAEIEKALDLCVYVAEKLKDLPFPEFELKDVLFASITDKDYPILKGDIQIGQDIVKLEEFEDYFKEYEVEYSTAKRCQYKGKTYLVGPLARFNNAYEKLSPIALELSNRIGLHPPLLNPYKSLLVRMVEMVDSLERALKVVKNYKKPDPTRIEVKPKAYTGYGISEAPRGMLYHSYTFDEEGKILKANIVPPTSQNQDIMEKALVHLIPNLNMDEETVKESCESMIRNFDPCISCATHFLKVSIKR